MNIWFNQVTIKININQITIFHIWRSSISSSGRAGFMDFGIVQIVNHVDHPCMGSDTAQT